MSEQDLLEQNNAPTSFAAKVWQTFQLVNISDHVQEKGNHKLSYLPWASAWQFVMESFPESSFEFDEPKMFENRTGEQWVTVTIKDGEQELTRRWWLPYLNYNHAPVENPNAMQINNTRMRVLVKCLAMLGLGTELYTGEDVPDKDSDKKPVKGSSVVAAVLEDVEVDWDLVAGHVATIKAAQFNEDDQALRNAMDKLASDNDMKVAVWSKLDPKTRAYIKALAKGDE